MATQLGVINDALDMLGETNIAPSELANLSNKPARVMSSGWPSVVDQCLNQAPWRFASRIVSLSPYRGDEADPSIYAAPGYFRAFEIPEDHLRTNWLRETANEATPPLRFHMQDGFWHANSTILVASYVSHDYRPPEHWTPLFAKAVAAYLAWDRRAAVRPAADENECRQRADALMDQAKNVDASETPFAWHYPGRLVRSRGASGRYRDMNGYRV